MLGFLSSLRLRVLASMLVPAVVVLTGAFFLVNHIETASQRNSAIAADREVAYALVRVAEVPSRRLDFETAQRLLGDDQLIIIKGGHVVFRGPVRPPRRHRFRVIAPFRGGVVIVIGDVDTTTLLSLKLTAVAAAVLVLTVGLALVGTWTLTRSVRMPIRRAVEAADRVAAGDLTARMGDTGPEELRHLARAFDGMAVRLEEADRRQREFLADLAHEIATPLGSVAGLASAAFDGTIATEDDRAEAAHLLEGELRRLRTLLDDLRRLRSLEGQATAAGATEPLQLDDLVRGIAQRFSGDARAAGLDLSVRTRRVRITSNPALIETVLTNLMSNAIRYTSAGGRVEVAIHQPRRGTVGISVRDTGIGIPPEHRGRIFDRFYRADQARDRVGGGSGLGLSLAARAAMALGGRIEVQSELGVGSRFLLVLPGRPPRAGHDGGAAEEADADDRRAADPPASQLPARSP